MKAVSIVALLAAMWLSALAAAETTKPSLRYVSPAAPRVVGAHFKPGERIGLTLRTGNSILVRSARASSAGKFTVDLAALGHARCSGTIVLVAVGANGDRASFTVSQPCHPGTEGSTPTTSTTPGTTTIPGLNPPPPYTT